MSSEGGGGEKGGRVLVEDSERGEAFMGEGDLGGLESA